jgi:hypothetical protein
VPVVSSLSISSRLVRTSIVRINREMLVIDVEKAGTRATEEFHHRQSTRPTEYDISIIEQSARLASIAIERSVAAEKIRSSEALYPLLTEDAADVVSQFGTYSYDDNGNVPQNHAEYDPAL